MGKWIKGVIIRALKAFASAAVGVMGSGQIGILEVDWVSIVSISCMAAVMSILMNVAELNAPPLE